MKRRSIIIAAMALLGLVAVLGVISYPLLPLPPPGGGGSGWGREIPVRRGSIHLVIAAKGKVEPLTEVRVGAKTIGRIKEISVKEGNWVKEGQVLAMLDDAELRAQLEQAKAAFEAAKARLEELLAGPRAEEREAAKAKLGEARAVLEEARAQLNRYTELLKEGAISHSQFDEVRMRHEVALAQYRSAQEQLKLVEAGAREEVKKAARAAVKQAEADLRHIQAQLQNTVVTAPISGKVLRKHLDIGDVVSIYLPQPLFTIADTSRLRVRAEVDETDIRKLKVGQEASVTADAYPGRSFQGKVVEIGEVLGKKGIRSENPAEMLDVKVLETKIELDPAFSHQPSAVSLPAPVPLLPLGLTVDVMIIAAKKEGVLTIPLQAVRREGGEAFVTMKANGSYTPRKIVTGLEDDDSVEVISGLQEGEIVLVKQ